MKQNNIKITIKEYFFVNPSAKLRVRQIERELKIPLPSVLRYVKELESEDILSTLNLGNVVFYTANRSSNKYLLEKKLFNIFSIYNSGFIDFIMKELSNPPVIVFGSYAKGEDLENSDIDLYIETQSNRDLRLENFEQILKRKIQIFKYQNIHKVKNPYLANNIINGVILNGLVEVFQ